MGAQPDDRELDDALSAARGDDSDAPGMLLAQRGVAARLFGDEAAGLGRFRVLERLGGGGMGVVYAAYDPQLDRGVALKTVHVPTASEEVALREAKALAKLSHPNVVPVFDVGFEAEHVYIVMELVRGQTLRAWVKERELRDVLDVYRQAGLALAAAHDAGLVHRDFKPDNAIVGTDGRVRVVDFGLACEANDATRRAGGTPKYMAPEQARGKPATPEADQYSFGISLGEAVVEPRPRWVQSVIDRATAAETSARYASMHELLRELARDPVRLRRRRLALGGGVLALAAVGAAAFTVGRTGSGGAPIEEPCAGAERELDVAWQAPQLARLGGLSTYGKSIAPEVGKRLDAHRDRWIKNHRAACVAHLVGAQSDSLLDRRMACLDRSRAALVQLADVVRAADATTLPDIVRATNALPSPDACADVNALLADVAPPPPAAAGQVTAVRRDLERARVLIAAGQPEKARDLAAAAVSTARATGYVPAVAEALLVEGQSRMTEPYAKTAIERLHEASTLAIANGMTAAGVEAWARRAWLEGIRHPHGPVLDGADVIDALATNTTPFARALLHNNLGSVALAGDDRAKARAELARALEAAREVRGPGAVELGAIRITLAIAVDDPAEKDRLLRDAEAEATRLEGADHPDTLRAAWLRATMIDDALPSLATRLLELCTRDELHAAYITRTTECWVELATVRDALGDREGALAAAERALAFGAEARVNTAEAAGYALLWRGDAEGARAAFERAIARIPVKPDELWFQTYPRTRLQVGLARALEKAHPAEAAALLDTAIAALAKLSAGRGVATMDRQLARARAERARLTAR